MSDYVKREDAIRALCDAVDNKRFGEWLYTDEFCKVINNMPSADVVEVVRCKDCKYWSDANTRYNQPCNRDVLSEYQQWTNADHYCSFAERREK